MPLSGDEYDPVSKPKHYNEHASGIECIEVTRHMSFNLGNAMKYVWRADLKNGVQDLEKAVWYLQDEIAKRQGKQNPHVRTRDDQASQE